MEHLIDPENFVGLGGTVTPCDDDVFSHEFEGWCIGVRNGFLQMRDQDGEVYDVEVRQFTPNSIKLMAVRPVDSLPVSVSVCSPREIARKIAEHLFTVGGPPPNTKATSLRMYEGERYLAGWGEQGVIDAVEKIISDSMRPIEP